VQTNLSGVEKLHPPPRETSFNVLAEKGSRSVVAFC
jgi:hypothetical protein